MFFKYLKNKVYSECHTLPAARYVVEYTGAIAVTLIYYGRLVMDPLP